jgi:hypothetical protein
VLVPNHGNRDPEEWAQHVPGKTPPIASKSGSPLPHYNQDIVVVVNHTNTTWPNPLH